MGLLENMQAQSIERRSRSNGNGGIAEWSALAYRIAETLTHITEQINQGLEADEYQRLRKAVTCDANGVGEIHFTPPRGMAWELVTLAVTGTVNASLGLYLDEIDGLNLIYGATTATLYSDNFGAGEYIAQNQKLICYFTGQTANSRCTITIRAKRLTPNVPIVLANADGGQ